MRVVLWRKLESFGKRVAQLSVPGRVCRDDVVDGEMDREDARRRTCVGLREIRDGVNVRGCGGFTG